MNEVYKSYPKHIYFNGLKFYRDDNCGYYRHCISKGNPLFLHRYVWEFHNGTIPKGYEIHHIDGNKSNNNISNLMLIENGVHQRMHNMHPTEKQKAYREKHKPIFLEKSVLWHKSEEGKNWHKQHAKEMIEKNQLNPKIEIECIQCHKKTQNIKGTKFCSRACKSKWRREHHIDDIEVICSLCGKKFMRNKLRLNKNGLNYCSKVCASKVMYAKTHNLQMPQLVKFFYKKTS